MEDRLEQFVDPVDGTRWQVDLDFLASSWRCIWDAGCQGIEDVAAPEAGLGCCSVGARLLDDEEAMTIDALAATLPSDIFQFAARAREGVLRDDVLGTRVVDGACIFLNRPGFSGGHGCALHIGAERDGEDPKDWKPAVCWQLPLKVERHGDSATLRRWTRQDWGSGGETMAWCCTEPGDAYRGGAVVIDSLASELDALVGAEVMVAIRRRLRDRT